MIIECNKCKSLFRLDEGLLRVNGSKVRCSVCKYIFIAYPPGWEPGADEKSRPLDQTLGETVILESPPVLKMKKGNPCWRTRDEEDFEAAFDEEAVTKRLQAVPSDRFPQGRGGGGRRCLSS
jgi:predicted Zn finger-like uncharacterized protein